VCVVYVIVILSVFPAGGLQDDRKPELTKGHDLSCVDLCVDYVDLCIDPIVLCVDHTELQWRRWTVLDLAVMIAVGVQHKMSSPSVFVRLFKYFDPVHTHLWLVNSY